MEHRFEIATKTLCLCVRVQTYSRECDGMLGAVPFERNVCLLYTCYFESSKSLDFFSRKNHYSSSKVANWIIVDILKYHY